MEIFQFAQCLRQSREMCAKSSPSAILSFRQHPYQRTYTVILHPPSCIHSIISVIFICRNLLMNILPPFYLHYTYTILHYTTLHYIFSSTIVINFCNCFFGEPNATNTLFYIVFNTSERILYCISSLYQTYVRLQFVTIAFVCIFL